MSRSTNTFNAQFTMHVSDFANLVSYLQTLGMCPTRVSDVVAIAVQSTLQKLPARFTKDDAESAKRFLNGSHVSVKQLKLTSVALADAVSSTLNSEADQVAEAMKVFESLEKGKEVPNELAELQKLFLETTED